MKILIPSILIASVIALICFSTYHFKQNHSYLLELKGLSIKGRIEKLDDKHRGFHEISISKNEKEKQIVLLHISYFILQNEIAVGDSISKDAQNDLLYFFKKDAIGFQPCCVYRLEID